MLEAAAATAGGPRAAVGLVAGVRAAGHAGAIKAQAGSVDARGMQRAFCSACLFMHVR